MGQKSSRDYDNSDHAPQHFTDSDSSVSSPASSPEPESRAVNGRSRRRMSSSSSSSDSHYRDSFDGGDGSDRPVKMTNFPEFSLPMPNEFQKDLMLSGHVLPEEVLCFILSKVDVEYLPTCRGVSRTWRYIIDTDIWRHVHPLPLYRQLVSAKISSFSVHYMLLKKKPFKKNLIKNPCGSEGYNFWDKQVSGWSDGWAIENPPQGADPVPVDNISNETHCFATSYQLCFKTQEINLVEVGVAPIIMDKLKPTIHVNDWYAGRFDCACEYHLRVALLNEERAVLDELKVSREIDQWQGRAWNQVSHEFKDYPEGVRYIVFFHSGKDRQFWKGHYGSKMTKSCVKLLL